ncbi:hypothetical protein B484DRAFT_392821, partial [Ochromonadaceae sp. CCMP2298]
MGYKKVPGKVPNPKGPLSPAQMPRDWVEQGLCFGGFVAFECKIRADSAIVMKSLLQSDHKVSMLTGDALLTSLHVAREVCIVPGDALTLTLSSGGGATPTVFWLKRDENTGNESEIRFDVTQIRSLSDTYALLTTEPAFLAAAEMSGGKTSDIWKNCDRFQVFARMSPQGKAAVI